MVNISKKNITLIIIAASFILVVGAKAAVEYYRMSPSRISESARTKGDPDAPVKIIEYIDFQCPACAQGAVYLKQFMEEHPDIVHLQMKYFPLSGHKFSLPSSKYAECAGRQGKFWAYHDKLVEQQKNWVKLGDAVVAFDIIAKDVGLDMDKLKECFADSTVNDVILSDKEEGSKLGIRSTPSYIINGKLTVGSKALKDALDKHI